MFTADPSAHVFDGKIYIYPSHDIELDVPDDDDGDQYMMEDYHVLSMDDLDSPCVDNGVAIYYKDIPWVRQQMWAPDCVRVNGKYYLVFPAKDKDLRFRIGVAESDSPVGPFKPQENYIEGSYSIDPAVLVDDDGRIYCYNGGLWGGQLEMWQSGSFNPDEPRPEGEVPALGPLFAEFKQDMTAFVEAPRHIQILDENGTMAIPVSGGTNIKEDYVGAAFDDYDSYLILSHFKGHPMAGFGGAIKNISIGLAAREGKFWIHSAGKTKSKWDSSNQDGFLESMGEAGKAVSDHLGDRITYVSVMNRLSVDCDCVGRPEEPDMHDIGILSSSDPVALDQACVDLVYAAEDGEKLIRRIESKNGLHTLEHAAEIGLGSREYQLVMIDD